MLTWSPRLSFASHLIGWLGRRFIAKPADLSLPLADTHVEGIEASTGHMTAHVDSPRKQAYRAARDTTAFMKIGVAEGHGAKARNPYALDAGRTFGLIADDLSGHLSIFGYTGTGMTQSDHRTHALRWLAAMPASKSPHPSIDGLAQPSPARCASSIGHWRRPINRRRAGTAPGAAPR